MKEIFEAFLEVGYVRETCREMSRRGVFSKRYTNKHGAEKGGGHFTVPSLFRILTNRAYIGLREINKSKNEVEAFKASWDGIVDTVLFEKVQKKLAANKNKFKPDTWKKYPYPLTEKLVCAECGKKLGGKSAHGKNKKHHYYSHPRQIHSDGVSQHKRCRIETLRAERIEDILLKSIKSLLETPNLIEHWLEIYSKNNNSEIPALEGKMKTIDSEMEQKKKRVQNLIARIAELPSEIPADNFYKQINEWNQKITELENLRKDLVSKSLALKTQAIDKSGLIEN